jgi:hypothetical protein
MPHAQPRPLPFERLDVYRVAIDLVRLAGAVPAVRGAADARDQLRRAAASVAELPPCFVQIRGV